ncbi:MAG: hypothetical protein QOD06_2235 [Candidatus Binatota bacterium]|nr:hypothetical protein [Candidatus Binatota bacterium]
MGRKWALGAIALGCVLTGGDAGAFKPNEPGHLGITSDALTPIQRTAGGTTYQFSERALMQIRDANRNTDIVTFFGVAEHFDDEAFRDSSTRLVNLKASVISEITAATPNGIGARQDLGTALHTVQDFYAHSNWVELGRTTIEARLGRQVFDGPTLQVQTCPSSPGTLAGQGRRVATTGYFPFPDPCAGPPDGTPQGKCRHGLEFFCPEGLNKDAPGRSGFPSARGLAVTASRDYVNQILDDPRVAGNARALAALMDTGTPSGSVVILAGSLVDGVRDLPVPIDATIDEVTFTVSLENMRKFDIIDPSGKKVLKKTGTVIRIVDPAPGGWRVRLDGSGRYALNARAVSPLEIDKFGFVTFRGRLGHEGLGLVTTRPIGGATQVGLAGLIGRFESASFFLVDTNGAPIGSVPLDPGDVNAAIGEFVGGFKIPSKPFRVGVKGTDAAGFAYQRVLASVFQPQ